MTDPATGREWATPGADRVRVDARLGADLLGARLEADLRAGAADARRPGRRGRVPLRAPGPRRAGRARSHLEPLPRRARSRPSTRRSSTTPPRRVESAAIRSPTDVAGRPRTTPRATRSTAAPIGARTSGPRPRRAAPVRRRGRDRPVRRPGGQRLVPRRRAPQRRDEPRRPRPNRPHLDRRRQRPRRVRRRPADDEPAELQPDPEPGYPSPVRQRTLHAEQHARPRPRVSRRLPRRRATGSSRVRRRLRRPRDARGRAERRPEHVSPVGSRLRAERRQPPAPGADLQSARRRGVHARRPVAGPSSGDWLWDTARFPTGADGVPDVRQLPALARA